MWKIEEIMIESKDEDLKNISLTKRAE